MQSGNILTRSFQLSCDDRNAIENSLLLTLRLNCIQRLYAENLAKIGGNCGLSLKKSLYAQSRKYQLNISNHDQTYSSSQLRL